MTEKHDRQFRICDDFKSILLTLAIVCMVSVFGTSMAAAQFDLNALRNASRNSDTDDDATKPSKPAGSLGELSRLGQSSRANSGTASDSASRSAPLMFGSAPFDLQALQPLFQTPEPNAAVQSGPVLQHEAEKSLQAGDQTTAMQLMFGHMAAEYESAQSTLSKVKFSKLLRRPVWNVRFGVSMSVRDAAIDDEDPNPIPADADAGPGFAARPQAATPNGDQPGSSASTRDSAADRLAKALGTLGNDRRTRATPSRTRPAASNPRSAGLAADSVAKSATDKDLSAAAPEPAKPEPTFEEMLGLVAQVVGEEFSLRYNRGDFGPLLVDLSNPSPDEAADDSNADPTTAPSAPAPTGLNPLSGLNSLGGGSNPLPGARPLADPTADSVSAKAQVLASVNSLPIWRPGIVSLGNGSSKEMIEKARKEQLDFLIHFDVILKVRTGSPVQNISRCRLINVATGKSIGLSKVMDSSEESKLAGGESGGREYVNSRLENFMSILDRDVKVIEMPKLTPESARRRLGMLLGSSQQRSLRTLAEIRLYEMRELLTRNEVEAAFDMVGGSDSLLFLYGSPEERASMARTWAAESTKKKSDS